MLSAPKCKNFLIFALGVAMGLLKRREPTTRWMQTKDHARHRALQIAADEENRAHEVAQLLPFPQSDDMKLLGLKLDSK